MARRPIGSATVAFSTKRSSIAADGLTGIGVLSGVFSATVSGGSAAKLKLPGGVENAAIGWTAERALVETARSHPSPIRTVVTEVRPMAMSHRPPLNAFRAARQGLDAVWRGFGARTRDGNVVTNAME